VHGKTDMFDRFMGSLERIDLNDDPSQSPRSSSLGGAPFGPRQGLTLVYFLAQRKCFEWDRGCIWGDLGGVRGCQGGLGGVWGVFCVRNSSG
jgi:hypothetical protein